MKPMVYVAGPYTSPSQIGNISRALNVGADLLDTGLVTPIVPHLTGMWDLVRHRPYEEWLAYDLEVMRRCDAVLRIPGDSPGADTEVAEAVALGIPVFHSQDDLLAWADWMRDCYPTGDHLAECLGDAVHS